MQPFARNGSRIIRMVMVVVLVAGIRNGISHDNRVLKRARILVAIWDPFEPTEAPPCPGVWKNPSEIGCSNINETARWDAIGKPKPNEMMFGRIFYRYHNWGIGFESMTMVVTVLSAVIVIFTFTHELFKQTDHKILEALQDILRK
jgi:hypothetical protein